MSLKENTLLVQAANLTTDSTALSKAFADIGDALSLCGTRKDRVPYVDSDAAFEANSFRQYGHLQTLKRGIQMIEACTVLAKNPVYTFAVGDNLFWHSTALPANYEFEIPEKRVMSRRTVYIFASEQLAEKVLNELKEEYKEFPPVRIVRVLSYAISEIVGTMYHNEKIRTKPERLTFSNHPLEPEYCLYGSGFGAYGGDRCDTVPGKFFDNIMLSMAIGAVNHSFARTGYTKSEDYQELDRFREAEKVWDDDYGDRSGWPETDTRRLERYYPTLSDK